MAVPVRKLVAQRNWREQLTTTPSIRDLESQRQAGAYARRFQCSVARGGKENTRDNCGRDRRAAKLPKQFHAIFGVASPPEPSG